MYVQRCVASAVSLDTHLTAFDIGANQGEWALAFLDGVQKSGHPAELTNLHCFEPVSSTLKRLQKNLAQNKFGGIAHVHALALSDKESRMRMAIESESGGISTLCPEGKPAIGWIDVDVISLDDFCNRNNISHVHLVKSDTEGHDLSVLRGAVAMLKEQRIDAFQFEYNHRWVFSRGYLRDVFDMIAQMPYALARIRPNSIEVLQTWHPELERFFEANYLLVRRSCLPWFSAREGSFDNSNTYA